MPTTATRPLIAALQITLDGLMFGPDGEVDWVDSWSDGLALLPPVDAFVLGGGMYPGYEEFWTTVLDDEARATAILGRAPYPREIAYGRLAARTPHLVVSTTLDRVSWPSARVVHDLGEIAALKAAPGRAIYAVGGPRLIGGLAGADLLDELRLIVHPVIGGRGTRVFDALPARLDLDLLCADSTPTGRQHLTYRLVTSTAARAPEVPARARTAAA